MAAERSVNVRVRLKGANQFKKDMQDVNGSLSTMGGWLDTAKGILASDLISSGLNAIANAMRACWDASVDFETAMAGVQKTTGMSDVQLEAMGNELMNLSERIPVTAKELAGLAETSGQLGIAKDDITEFIEVVAAMGVSTNMSAETAATEMARIANIFGTRSQDYERMGSTIVELGNNMATTESEIVDMAMNMAGVGNLVGMSEEDVFAYAAAMSSVGIEAEAGASALTMLMTRLEIMTATGSADLKEFAEVAGMTSTEFTQMWSSDPAAALSALLTGMNQVGAAGGSAMSVVDDLGIKNERQSRIIGNLASASGLLAEALGLSSTAWEENTALAEEAGTFYNTTASQIQMSEDALQNLEAAAGDHFKPLVTSWATTGAALASSIRQNMTELQPMSEYISQNTDEYNTQMEAIAETDAQARSLIGSLEEMGDFSGLDAQGQAQYLAALQLIAELVPSTSGLIDLETGAIEGGTAALYANTDAARENAEQQAELNRTRENWDAYELHEEQLGQKRALLTVETDKLTRAEAEYNAMVERQQELREEAQAMADEYNAQNGTYLTGDAFITQVGERQGNLSEFEYLDQQIAGKNQEIQLARTGVQGLTEDIAAQAEAMEEYAYVADEYSASMESMGESYQTAIDGAENLSEAEQNTVDQMTLMSQQLESLEAELTEAMETARSQLDSVVHGFDAIEMPEAVSADELLENLQSQIDYMEAYQENLAAVQEMGLDADIVTMLSDGSTESAAILAGLAEDGGESIDALNAKFAEVGTAKDTMATAMAEASIDFQGRATEIVTACNNMVAEVNQYSEAYANGASTIQGIIDGINSRIGLLQNRVGRVQSLAAQAASAGSGGTSHAAGLTYVPYDGYLAQLHRGEMVLTALEARAYRAQQFADYGALAALEARGGTVNNDYRRVYDGRIDNSVRVGDIYVRNETDISRLERQLTGRSRSVARGYGAMGR